MDAEFQELVELLEELIVVVLLLRDLREHHEALIRQVYFSHPTSLMPTGCKMNLLILILVLLVHSQCCEFTSPRTSAVH